MSLLQEGLRRYLSEKDLLKLRSIRIGIAGAGGLGSNCAMLLVRSGIGKLTLVDSDLVDASNLNRQFFFPKDVGIPKVEALSCNLKGLEPDLDLRLFPERLDAENIMDFFSDCSIVVEALDKAEDKAMLCEILIQNRIPVVSASGLGGKSGPPMQKRKVGKHLICVGDFVTVADEENPPFSPRVMQAASLQAEAVLEVIFSERKFTEEKQ